MANTGWTVEVPAPPVLRGRGGLLDSLRQLGLVVEFVDLDSVSGEVSARQRDGIEPLPDGLWVATKENTRWASRSQHRPVGCGDVSNWVECADAGSYTAKTTTESPENATQDAWVLYADDDCSTVGLTVTGAGGVSYEERVRRATENLVRKQSNAIADELWHGTLAVEQSWSNLYLASAATRLTAPGESSPLSYALGALQEALAECLGDGQAGIIHATRTTVTAWWKDGALNWDADRGVLLDAFDNVVVASGGYDGADPDGIVVDTIPWAYATGPVVVRLGPVEVRPSVSELGASIDRASNDLTVFAERAVSYQFDPCCVFGIGVNLCDTCCIPEGS